MLEDGVVGLQFQFRLDFNATAQSDSGASSYDSVTVQIRSLMGTYIYDVFIPVNYIIAFGKTYRRMLFAPSFNFAPLKMSYETDRLWCLTMSVRLSNSLARALVYIV